MHTSAALLRRLVPRTAAATARCECARTVRLGARSISSLRRLAPREVASNAQNSQIPSGSPTIYVTGFLTDTTCDKNWEEWLESHRRLAPTLSWGDDVYGLDWRTGSAGDRLGRWPLPMHLALLAVRRSSLQMLAAGVAADALLNAARLLLQFREVRHAAAEEAPRMAAACEAVVCEARRRGGDGSYRLVAHSLGCRLALEALPLLPPERRPIEVHLCAAAATATDAAGRIGALCTPEGGRVFHHYSPYDEALQTGFMLASGGEAALGSAPLPPALHLPGTTSSHDATPYLHSFAPHGEYRSKFDALAAGAVLARPAPKRTRPAWVAEQQRLLTARLKRALERSLLLGSSVRRWARRA
jgi:hypothetical protein